MMPKRFKYLPEPLHAPERDPGYRSELAEVRRTARAMGISELQPWQELVIDRATEYRLNDEGERVYRYSRIMVTVPRQSGKTYLLGPVRLHRMITRPGSQLFSTAQTGKAARQRMLALVDLVEESPLGAICKGVRQNGGEGIRIPALRSNLQAFAPVESAVHGDTPALVDFDEIWKYSLHLGNALMNAASPAQVTLYGRAQMWFISTMGTQQSEFMNTMVETGRAGSDRRLAYFEWSLPDGADPYDEAAWWQFHPALGNTIQLDALRDEAASLPEGDWLRAYCNRLTDSAQSLVPIEQWDEMTASTPPPALETVRLGLEVAPGSTCAAVTAAWRDEDGTARVHVVHQAPGTGWVIPYVRLLRAAGARPLAVDDHGPVTRFITDLEGDVQPLTFAQRRLADQTLIAEARDDGTLQHDGSRPLRVAITNAYARRANGVELIDRDRSTAPVPSLIAASVALWLYDNPPAQDDPVQLF